MLFASNNEGKIKELKKILKNYDIRSLKDLNIDVDIEENGKTFIENAIIKAKEIYKLSGIPTIADDSGLEITSLNNFPGVLTHRFLGPNKTDHERNEYILDKLSNETNRTCYFISAIAFYDGTNLITVEEKLEGKIAYDIKDGQGFGFDSIFLYNEKHLSDMTIDEKNIISPRAKANLKLLEKLENIS